MIDIENDIFSYVATKVRDAHTGIYVAGEYVNAPPSFPAVSIIQNGNSVLQRMRTVNIENAVSVMFEVNIYSNKVTGKKAEAKSIAETLDNAFAEIGFTRTMCNQVANFADATIYRIVCRYEAVIDKNYMIYQNY